MPTQAEFEALLGAELTQLAEEGCETESLTQELGRIRATLEKQAESLYELLLSEAAAAKPREGFPYHEPSTLAEIKMARSPGARHEAQALPSDDELQDRLLGAWLGRCSGCMLGKPVEGRLKTEIDALLEAAGVADLDDYFPPIAAVPPGVHYPGPDNNMLRGNVTHGVRDDDTDYTVLGLHYLEDLGPDFDSKGVAQQWLEHLPFHCVYTAERVAYQNLVNGLAPPASASYRNPYREWIGAQIRGDAFGYVAPGWPAKAAELAFRDACVSHIKNGIYGEMFFAALIAAALGGSDLPTAINAALAEIPERSRLAEAMRNTVEWCERADSWLDVWSRIESKYGHYHPVHTINNAAVVLMGLLIGRREEDPAKFHGRAIALAVRGGWDTDCNGATAGSVAGALVGARALDAKWTAPLNDRLESIVVGMTDNRISDLAQRTLVAAKRVRGAEGDGK